MGAYRRGDFVDDASEARKRVSCLIHTGNVRGTSVRKSTFEGIRRNRILMLILAFLVLSSGVYSIFSRKI